MSGIWEKIKEIRKRKKKETSVNPLINTNPKTNDNIKEQKEVIKPKKIRAIELYKDNRFKPKIVQDKTKYKRNEKHKSNFKDR